jgi:hypothetical protein
LEHPSLAATVGAAVSFALDLSKLELELELQLELELEMQLELELRWWQLRARATDHW